MIEHRWEAQTARVAAIRAEARTRAGGAADLALRASSYRALYAASGGTFTFPLLAAHGALWAAGYFRCNLVIGHAANRVLPLPGAARRHWSHDGRSPEARKARAGRLEAFADAFREINRRVCEETWAAYHLTAHPRVDATAAGVPSALVDALALCHDAARRRMRLSPGERHSVFEAFFRWEQESVVAPAVTRAFAMLDWPLAEAIARRPRIGFRYFPRFTALSFRDFGDQNERIAHGLKAHALAERVGWSTVERSLDGYGVALSAPKMIAVDTTPCRPVGYPLSASRAT
ncbi:MAG: hypothetical protein AAF577_06610 [Pseudomonadota bacterium]